MMSCYAASLALNILFYDISVEAMREALPAAL